MDKLKEALLVTERHRTKMYSSLNNLPDLSTFEQIIQLVSQKSIACLIYFSQVDVSSTLNCWLLQPNNQEVVKFHQVSYKSLESLFTTKIAGLKTDLSNFIDEILKRNEEDQNILLREAYNLLFKPFETFLLKNANTNSAIKPLVYIVYDEKMFKMPFHLLKTSRFDSTEIDSLLLNEMNNRYLYEIFEIDCVYSIKYLFRNKTYMQKYTKNHADSNFTIPMRVISNEDDMEKLLSNSTTYNTKNNTYQYDLLLLLVNSEHKGQIL